MNAQRTVWTSIVALVVLSCGTQWANAYVGFGKPTNRNCPDLSWRCDGYSDLNLTHS
jgi:hypothetical protein